jgi:CBS domain-containing protein
MSATVQQILQYKGSDIWSVTPRATVYEALRKMAEKDVGALLVVDDGRLVGIFSERDYARKIALKGLSSKEALVKDMMTPSVVCISTHRTVEDCMELMTTNRVRHLPVVEDDLLIGIVTIGDVVKRIISEQERTIHQLEQYIAG